MTAAGPPASILALTRYDDRAASTRYRFSQYAGALREAGMPVSARALLSTPYDARLGRPVITLALPMARAYAARARDLAGAGKHGLLWLQAEALPWLPHPVERALLARDVRYAVDYDDAWFHRYDQHRRPLVRWLLGRKIDAVMRGAALVVAGNAYIAARARAAGAAWVEVVPTVVDLLRYPAACNRAAQPSGPPVIGWIGSTSTTRFVLDQRGPLGDLVRAQHARVVLVGASSRDIASTPFEAHAWSGDSEAAELAAFDVGIMPLPDTPWTRGKCGLKLIQYMAAGKPCVASPVGANAEIVVDGVTGFHARSAADWRAALDRLLADPDLRARMGAAGRARAEARYSLQATAPGMVAILGSALRRDRPL